MTRAYRIPEGLHFCWFVKNSCKSPMWPDTTLGLAQPSAQDWTRWLAEVPSHLRLCYLNEALRQRASWCSAVRGHTTHSTEMSWVNSTQPRQGQWGLGQSLQPAWASAQGKSTVLHKTQLKKYIKMLPYYTTHKDNQHSGLNDPGISKSYMQSLDFCSCRLTSGHAIPSAQLSLYQSHLNTKVN